MSSWRPVLWSMRTTPGILVSRSRTFAGCFQERRMVIATPEQPTAIDRETMGLRITYNLAETGWASLEVRPRLCSGACRRAVCNLRPAVPSRTQMGFLHSAYLGPRSGSL